MTVRRNPLEAHYFRLLCVRLWNHGGRTYSEIGFILGIPREAVGRLLTEARALGIDVRRTGVDQTKQRAAHFRFYGPRRSPSHSAKGARL